MLSIITCLNQTFLTTHPCFRFFLFLAETFKQVARTVTDVELTDNIVDVVYKMFDENGNTLVLIIRLFIWLKVGQETQ